MSDDIEIQFRGGYAKKWHSESTVEISEIIHRIPAGLDTAHVGYNFINVLGRVHYGSRAQLPKDD